MTDPTQPTEPETPSEAAASAPAPEAVASEATAAEATAAEATATEAPVADGVDASRRRFFREFASEVFQGAATVVGAAQALQRASAEAAGAILDPGSIDAARSTGAAGRLNAAAPGAAAPVGPPTGFRTPFREDGGILYLIDQRRLPDELVEVDCRSAADVTAAIRDMVIRGAPAIGQVAALGLAMTVDRTRTMKPYARRATIRGAAAGLISARPTAVNLRWAVDRLMDRYLEVGDLSEDGDAISAAVRGEAEAIVMEATLDHGQLATHGLSVLVFPEVRPLNVLTHCNTGPLACGQYGTALGVVQAAHHAGRSVHIWVDETRPYLQGARLTAWELAQAGVPHTLLPDVAAGHLMARGEVDVVVVGADRVAANGDTANKVGTYPLAVLAARHGIPFYVAAPTSTIDLETPDGSAIPIEERKAREVLEVRGVRIAPPDTPVRNPAFDVTPADLISGVITEEGVLRPPYPEALAAAVAARAARREVAPALPTIGPR